MTRLFEWLVELLDRLRGVFGFHRLTKRGRGDDLLDRGMIRRIFYFVRPILMLLIMIYLGTMIWRFNWMRGEDLGYPQVILASVVDEPAAEGAKTCAKSRIVAMESALLDLVVHQNDWTPATPQYKLGFFYVISWERTPWFDNKASFQVGVLEALRRISIELTDTLGRERGTSEADRDLTSALGRLQVDERTWAFNPFDDQLPTLASSAASSYSAAIDLYDRFNERLGRCDALFDTRADNLELLLDRIAKDLGSMVEVLARRSQGERYDVATHSFVPADGNDYGWFDFRADNLFHNARGRMYAYHGLLQGARADFADVIERRNLTDVWNRLEAHVAEAAVLAPLIVSNGREDGFMMPNHLSVMAQNVLRARSNLTELRGILSAR